MLLMFMQRAYDASVLHMKKSREVQVKYQITDS